MFGRVRKNVPERRGSQAEILWAIGDVHGRHDLLARLLQHIREEAQSLPLPVRVIILGDFIDRGAQTKEVIDDLLALHDDDRLNATLLMGNHEQQMLAFLQDWRQGEIWCRYGGDSTLASFGLRPPTVSHSRAGWEALSEDLRYRLGARRLQLLRQLQYYAVFGSYLFVHAGIRPGRPLAKQSVEDLLSIRKDFTGSSKHADWTIVHGHTRTAEVHSDARRISIDTGAYQTGRLSSLKILEDEQCVIEAKGSPGGDVEILAMSIASP